jgi:PAS domain S-box-containing protein
MTAPGELDGAALDALARTLLADLPDAVIYADRDGAIRFWNPGAERIFGFNKTEAIGRSLDIIIPERLRKRHWDGYAHMMQTGRSSHSPDELLAVPAVTKAGESVSIQFTVAPVHDDAGHLTGIVAVLRDVTATFREMKRLRAEAAAR